MPTTPLCFWCSEPVRDGEESGRITNAPSHEECAIRSLIGGLNHQRRTCHCWGGNDPPDPPELTPRNAARVAYAHWFNGAFTPRCDPSK